MSSLMQKIMQLAKEKPALAAALLALSVPGAIAGAPVVIALVTLASPVLITAAGLAMVSIE